MEELKIIMEALSDMSEGASTAFMWWCIQNAFVYFMAPVCFSIVCFTFYKIVYRIWNVEQLESKLAEARRKGYAQY